MTIGALIPAAGLSSRMGLCKTSMDLLGRPTLTWVVGSLHTAGIQCLVVTGHWRDEVAPLARSMGCQMVHNPNYRQGMFSSVVTGFKAMPPHWGRIFLLPADIPLVRPATLRRLTRREGSVIYPIFNGQRGHPPLLNRDITSVVLDWYGEDGLRGALRSFESRAIQVPVSDQGTILDMDDQDDLKRIREMARRRDIPTSDERRALESLAGTPERVRRHQAKVAETAAILGNAAKRAGLPVDQEALMTAGLLHDLCRTEKDHGAAGASMLREHGFELLANIVAHHMDYPYRGVLDEGAILYLADKLTCDDRLCSLDERLQRMLSKFQDRPTARESAKRRLAKARSILNDMTDLIGNDPMKILR